MSTRLNGYSPDWSSQSSVEYIKEMYQKWEIAFDRTNILGDNFISSGIGAPVISAKNHKKT